MRLTRLSLAGKYRILFGTAVLLIIGAALAVPWYRMSALVREQLFQEARGLTDEYFRRVMATPGAASAAGSGVHGKDFGLLPERSRQTPRFVRASLDPRDPQSLTSAASDADPFVARATAFFYRHPQGEFTYTMREDPDGQRRFLYAHAVRVTKRCLTCHDEGRTATPYHENALAGVITVGLPAGLSDQQLAVNRWAIIAAGALAGVLAILVFYVITQKITLSPINELRQVALRVADGDLDVRSTLRTGDEFEHLSDNLNTMLERLRDSQGELRHANKLLDQKLGEMAESNVALFESNRLKSEFLASVSHELRTPLTSIIGFAELLREGPNVQQEGRYARYAENILISGRILLEIINDLLDLAKIEAGKVELSIENVDVGELCRTLANFARPMADQKKLDLACECPADLPPLRTDRGRLRQVLFNLLSNAIKFTPPQGSVRMTARRLDDEHVRLTVSDTGPGVAPDDREIIFEKFRQADQSATREHHGTGLGLAIAKELTHLLGGCIGVDSEPGKGAAFWLELPIRTSATGERPPISLV